MLKRLVRATLKLAGSVPGARTILEMCAMAPASVKSPSFHGIVAALASGIDVDNALIETNLGLGADIRLLIPSNKTGLLYSRLDSNLAERGTIALARALARKSCVFIDVGANEGIFAFAVAATLGLERSHEIHAFEPDPELYSRLAANVARNGLAASVNNCAVSNTTGRQTFYRDTSSDLSGSLTTHFASRHETVTIDVATTSLSDYLVSRDLSGACVKVDVEGAGVAVWEGAVAAIDRIDWFIIEIIGPEADADLPARIIAESGWNAFYLRDYELVPSHRGEFEYVDPFYNWLFTRHSRSVLEAELVGSRLRVCDGAGTV
jgi:FkbM family methyltransferase